MIAHIAVQWKLVLICFLLLTQLNLATNLGLIVFCWGDENNSKETIKFLKSLNIHGIIYDKMDKLSEKTEKVQPTNYLVKRIILHCICEIIIEFPDEILTNLQQNFNQFYDVNQQKSIFYVEGKESQKDILRLRQLEQPKHENGSPSTSFSEQLTPDNEQSGTSKLNTDLNGFSPGVAVQNQQ